MQFFFKQIISNSLVVSYRNAEQLHTDLPLLLVHHVQLLLAQPGLHLGRVKVVLLGLVHSIQDELPPLSLSPEQTPQLGQLVVTRPDAVGLRAAYGCDNPRPFQDVVDPAPVALQLPLKCLQRQRALKVKSRWTCRSFIKWRHKLGLGVSTSYLSISFHLFFVCFCLCFVVKVYQQRESHSVVYEGKASV